MGSESCVYSCSWLFLLLKSYWHNVNTNNSGSVALLLLCLLVLSYIKIVLCCWCSCTFWVTRTWWLHSASSSAVCTPLGPALQRAVTLVWSFSSTWLYTALALPQMSNASSHNLCLLDCREESLWGNVTALVAVKTLMAFIQCKWCMVSLLFILNHCYAQKCCISPVVLQLSIVFLFSPPSVASPLHSLLFPLRLTFYCLCSTGLFLFWRGGNSGLD